MDKQGKVSNFVSLDVSAVYVLLVIDITNFSRLNSMAVGGCAYFCCLHLTRES